MQSSIERPQPTSLLRTVLVSFVLLTCLRVWVGPQAIIEPAHAQLPDPAAQRIKQIDEARRTNELLTDIKLILESGTLNVRLGGADNPPDRRRDQKP